jgi:transposase
LLSAGQVADITVVPQLIRLVKPSKYLLADKAYDADSLRQQLIEQGTIAVIPNKSNRRDPYEFDAIRYRNRNTIERCFCRLKDFRRIATRYDKLSRNFLSAIQLAAALAYWLH